ncbi:MAG TPA: zf-HC2 domain-containing protein [Candidatus Krumholzibacteria bacterium]|nr:zf-HC2 domain-containing protein [Candidatus Krumholzibacteria bacterium]
MKCSRAQHLLFDFIDGLSNESLRVELDRHLGECPACEKFAAEMTKSLSLLHRAPLATLDENFNWKVRLAMHRERNAMRSGAATAGAWARAWNVRYAAGAGIAFALVLVAGAGLQRSLRLDSAPLTASTPVLQQQSAPARHDVATTERPATTGRSSTLPPILSTGGTLVSDGSQRGSLVGDGARPGAIDDPARSEALIDSLVERQLIPLAPEERERYIQRHIHRLQSRLQSQQAAPARP